MQVQAKISPYAQQIHERIPQIKSLPDVSSPKLARFREFASLILSNKFSRFIESISPEKKKLFKAPYKYSYITSTKLENILDNINFTFYRRFRGYIIRKLCENFSSKLGIEAKEKLNEDGRLTLSPLSFDDKNAAILEKFNGQIRILQGGVKNALATILGFAKSIFKLLPRPDSGAAKEEWDKYKAQFRETFANTLDLTREFAKFNMRVQVSLHSLNKIHTSAWHYSFADQTFELKDKLLLLKDDFINDLVQAVKRINFSPSETETFGCPIFEIPFEGKLLSQRVYDWVMAMIDHHILSKLPEIFQEESRSS